LHNAKIYTLGNRAEDTFLISANKGQRLDALRVLALKEALISEI
jgi:[protein-PII] uridylyltransferase